MSNLETGPFRWYLASPARGHRNLEMLGSFLMQGALGPPTGALKPCRTRAEPSLFVLFWPHLAMPVQWRNQNWNPLGLDFHIFTFGFGAAPGVLGYSFQLGACETAWDWESNPEYHMGKTLHRATSSACELLNWANIASHCQTLSRGISRWQAVYI